MEADLRVLSAGNAGPFTLDGTRTHIVGQRRPAVIDPGPDVEDHLRAVASAVTEAESVRVLLTHGHGDHAGGAARLLRLLADAGVPVELMGPRGSEGAAVLSDGAGVETDAGRLVALHTPGHTRHHLAFHWPRRRALFPGDLLLGRGDTTWVAEYPGCVADYLASLQRIRRLALEVILPAHGPPLDDAADAVGRFEAHRRTRVEEVRRARAARPDASPEELLEIVYGGTVPVELLPSARMSLDALLHHLDEA